MSEPPEGSSGSTPEEGSSDEAEFFSAWELDPLQQALLAQSTRREIVELLARAPGLNKQQIARRIGIHRRTLDSHLTLLTWAELVAVRSGERGRERICFTSPHAHLADDEATRILYGQAPTRRVALYICENEPVTTEETGQALDRSEEAIRQHAAKLRERGLTRMVRSAGNAYHGSTEQLRDWYEAWGEGYPRPWEEGE